MLFRIIIAELEQFVITGSDLKVPLPRLLPGFFYFLNLIFYTLPQKRLGSFGIGMTRIAVNF
jgi:hypothetical protein